MEETSPDLLADFVKANHLVRASSGKRLANLLIDYLSFVVLFVSIELITEFIAPGLISIFSEEDTVALSFKDRIIILVLYAVYMSLIEFFTKGKSLGKLITGSKAVNEDGSNITFVTAFKRGLFRIVPFETFTGLGSICYPWHDKWAHTYVIDVKKSSVLRNIE